MKRKQSYTRNETDLTDSTQVPVTGPTGYEGRKEGSTAAGKDLSDTRSSNRKGRKAAARPKKLEEEAD
jgi:hypothetical protein